ncbi:hypothetical protein BC826DRAFT_45935 [Russula brevipes]|nr:hypothetical protein BC826DRAFT_45935 [Russula brevipes]
MNPPHLRALPSQQWCISLSRSHSATDIRPVAAQTPSHYLSSNAAEARYQQQRRNSYHGTTTDFPSLNSEFVSAAPSDSSADSVTSSSWVYRRTEELHGVRYAIPTSDFPPITAGDQGASPVVQYPPTLSNPFSDTTTDAWTTPSGFVSTPSHTAQEYSVNESSFENVQDDREHAQRMADSCKEDAKGVLILSGVLSAIVAAFLIESYKMLPPADLGDGPPQAAASIVWVNIMWLMSLVLSITSTLFATMALQWARRFTQLRQILNTDTSRDRTHIPLFACCGTLRYDVHRAVSMILVFLHLSLFLFFIGLVVFFFTINKPVAIVVSMVIGLVGVAYFTITILACVDRFSPYHTPMSGTWWPQ